MYTIDDVYIDRSEGPFAVVRQTEDEVVARFPMTWPDSHIMTAVRHGIAAHAAGVEAGRAQLAAELRRLLGVEL